MLKVKNKSSKNGGMGNTTIANVANTIIGAPTAGIALWGMDGSLLANGKLNFMAIDGTIQPKLKDLDENASISPDKVSILWLTF
ncbi:hypothetical protein MHN79_08575 [Vibrio sp. Of14-4]|uniref:hypothetical protein n=1 Tax=Vibrio sp. Of14-4 TaxID=2724878 RepID=UPI001EF3831F|nr:hypothetical protein [Vibrio sp. Of14-4]MCG7489545.1 hypothetical protein [Vibrio sp. Of14-4]